MLRATIFDLDETLVDTSALRGFRDRREWSEVADRLGTVGTYRHEDSVSQAAELPAIARDRGLKVGVLTASPNGIAEALLNRFEIACDAMIGGSDSFPAKPDPQSLEELARRLGTSAEECVLIGDSTADFGAAGNAGAGSIGVAWSGTAAPDWERKWPDVAVREPDRAVQALADGMAMRPIAEVLADGDAPVEHWGSLIRRGEGTYAAGRYFSGTDRRQVAHSLSLLVLQAKDDPDSAEEVAEILAAAAGLEGLPGADLVVSVPPSPDSDYDRFEAVRPRVAAAIDSGNGGHALEMLRSDPGYKQRSHEERREVNRGRFRANGELAGERVLLIDDVLTSGGQAEACREALLGAGAGEVWVLALSATQDPLQQRCPVCGVGTLRRIVGRYGPFLGCTNYRRTGCPYTEDCEE